MVEYFYWTERSFNWDEKLSLFLIDKFKKRHSSCPDYFVRITGSKIGYVASDSKYYTKIQHLEFACYESNEMLQELINDILKCNGCIILTEKQANLI